MGELAVRLESVTPVCDDVKAACVCHLPINHDRPHTCGEPTTTGRVCGGQWSEDGDPVMMPDDITPSEIFIRLFLS